VNTFHLPHRFWLGTALLWLTAALLRWWAAPSFELLPTDYVRETSYTAKLWSRQTVLSAAEEAESVVRRRDQTLTSRDGRSIIQGDVHWLTPSGVVIFEILNLYVPEKLELWLPLTFAAAGLIWMAAGVYTRRRGAR
jgi:hypothetical protein